MNVITLILPVFAIIVTGWIFKRLKIFSEESSLTLIQYVYFIAAPAILIYALSAAPIEDVWNWSFIIIVGLIAFVGMFLLFFFYRVRNVSACGSLLYGLSAILSNAGFIGLPILYGVLGIEASFREPYL